MLWDVIVIGAGMSGLAAGLRLALAGKKVLVLEQHNAIGGLNGFYMKNGIKYDVGLHAVTNFVLPHCKGHPLIKLCRQLRIPYEALQLKQQKSSRIQFPEISLTFTNHFEHLCEEIAKHFSHEKDNFLKLDAHIMQLSDTALDGPSFISARQQLKHFIQDSFLQEMLLLPLFYYGSAHVNDLDWRQFAILYKAIYREGFARPLGGVRQILRLLRERFREWGGVLRVKTEVTSLVCKDRRVESVVLKSGEVLQAKQILSSVGLRETQALCGHPTFNTPSVLTFIETISTLDASPKTLNCKDTITFYSKKPFVNYAPAQNLVDINSGVICIPENYEAHELPERTTLRTTHLANYVQWASLSSEAYAESKKFWLENSRQYAYHILGCKPANVIAEDMFTPLTILKYTKHFQGAIYGAPEKIRNGNLGYENLFLCGTDQGFLGIVGALLSGISMANYHCLK